MAHKKKTPSRKHAKGRRHDGRTPQHKERTQTSPLAPFANVGGDVIEDMLPLLTGGLTEPPTFADADDMMRSLLASDHLADEPELQAIFFEPGLSVDTFVEVSEGMGITPESLATMSEEKRTETRVKIMAESMRRLLTDELRQEIMAGLIALRLRLKRSGKTMEAARVASLHLFLSADTEGVSWSSIGLVIAIFGRSLTAGFEMINITLDITGETDGKDDRPLLDRLMHSPLAKAADAFLNKMPGMRSFLEKEADKTWNTGQAAVFAGDPYLQLYSEEELIKAVAIIADVVGLNMPAEARAAGQSPKSISPKMGKVITQQLDDYVTQLFTPQRLEQLRGRLADVTRSPPQEKKWVPFLIMVQRYMAEKDAPKHEKPFLLNSLLGEITVVSRAKVQDDPEADREVTET